MSQQNGRLGYSRNDGRPYRKSKDPEKAERESRIREFAKNNGFSVRTARIMWENAEEENEGDEMAESDRRDLELLWGTS